MDVLYSIVPGNGVGLLIAVLVVVFAGIGSGSVAYAFFWGLYYELFKGHQPFRLRWPGLTSTLILGANLFAYLLVTQSGEKLLLVFSCMFLLAFPMTKPVLYGIRRVYLRLK